LLLLTGLLISELTWRGSLLYGDTKGRREDRDSLTRFTVFLDLRKSKKNIFFYIALYLLLFRGYTSNCTYEDQFAIFIFLDIFKKCSIGKYAKRKKTLKVCIAQLIIVIQI
jgi:hypothetical protein